MSHYIKLFPLFLILLSACSEEEEPENPWANMSGNYTGSRTSSNDNGLFSHQEDIHYTVKHSGNNLTITFHYGDDTGDVVLQCTDVAMGAYNGSTCLSFKIKEQKAGTKIQHTFIGRPYEYVTPANSHGYIEFSYLVPQLRFSTTVHSYYNDEFNFSGSASKDLVQ